MSSGEEGKIEYLDAGRGLAGRLYPMGIVQGNKVKMKLSQPFHGPCVVEVNDTTYSIGRGIANKIMVEYYENDEEP